jgi:transcriptional regulator with XRE-family HTH domain
MTLGQRIKKARERLKMTQPALAAFFDISFQAVSQWERDEGYPEYEKLPQLRLALRVNYAWLLEGSGEPPAPDDLEVLLDDNFASTPHKVRSSIAKALDNVRKRS